MPRPSRRAEVRAAAARLIRQHGYDSATMDLLADEVGLNKGTLYHYYPSKSAILYELMSGQVDNTISLMQQVPDEGTAGERFEALVRLQVGHVATQHDELVVFFQEWPWIERHLTEGEAAQLRSRVQDYVRFASRLLEEGIRAGEFRPLSVGTVLNSITGILAYVPEWFSGTSKRSRSALVAELTTFVMRGIRA